VISTRAFSLALLYIVPLMLTSLNVKPLALFTGLFVGLTTGVVVHLSRAESEPVSVNQPIAQVASSATQDSRANYKVMPLDQWTQSGSSLIGEQPGAIATQLLGVTEGSSESGLGQLEISYPKSGSAIVLLTQTGRQDDSVTGVKYRVELQSQTTASGNQWQVIWVGQQFKCQPGRGQQTWSAALCS